MNEPFSVKDWMRLALRIEADGSTDLDEVLATLQHAVDADLAWVVREGEVVARLGLSTDGSIDDALVASALGDDKRFEFESGGSCEIARRELPSSRAHLVAGREDDFTIEDHEAISTIAHLLDLGMGSDSGRTEEQPVVAVPSPLRDVFAGSDSLTGLVSRDALRTAVLADRDAGQTVGSVLVLDLDGFTIVNDTLGFPTGDLVLQAVASRIQTSIREEDVAARIGGDEFAVYCPGIGSDLTLEVADRVQSLIARTIPVGESDLIITASVGVATATGDILPDELLGNADTAMRSAKRRASGTVDVYDEMLQASTQEFRNLTAELQEAIADNQLTTIMQPIVAMPDGVIVARQALVRWQHPARGLLDPGEFLDIAERIGRIADIDRAVFSFALQEHFRSRDRGPVSINLSATSFLDRRQIDWMIDQLTVMNVDGGNLIVEVTEPTVNADPTRARTHLELLRAHGVGTALDRFGTGPTSVLSLHRFPFDGVKLDPSIVAGPEGERVLRSIHASAELCGFDVIHSRIGSDDVLDSLTELEARLGNSMFYVEGRAVTERVEQLV